MSEINNSAVPADVHAFSDFAAGSFHLFESNHFEDEMGTGTIKNWNNTRKFGFVKPDDGGDDLFFHLSRSAEMRETWNVGERVCFTERPSRTKVGKSEAFDVELV